MKEIMTTEEAAEVLGVHIATVRRWLNSGELPGYNTPAGWRITRDNVQSWLDKYRKPPAAQAPVEAASTPPAAEGDAPAVDWD